MYEELKERISKGQWAEAKKLANILEPAAWILENVTMKLHRKLIENR